jgi:exonuclease I
MTLDQLRQAAETYKEWRQVYDRRDKTSYERDIESGLYEQFKTARDLLDLPALLAEMERAERMREALENFANELHDASIAGGRAWDEAKLYALLRKCIEYRRQAAQSSGGAK